MLPLFHISFSGSLPNTMYPRQPQGLSNPDDINKPPHESIFQEKLPPRVSFGPSIIECFRAIWPNIHKYFTKFKYPHIDMYVYTVIKGNENQMLTPEKMTLESKLWDAHYTHEHCFLTKVKVAKVAKIRIMNPAKANPNGEILVDEVHPFGDEGHKAVRGSPTNLEVKVIRVYRPDLPLRIEPL